MKLAEALIERADLQKRLDQLEDRLQSNALVQDGEEPAEDPVALMAEYVTVSVSLEELITRINLTNAGTDVNGLSLTALIAKRDCLQKRVRAMRRFPGGAPDLSLLS